MLSNIKIVLLRPSHPGNVGSTARAMKNMGLANLALVAPQNYDVSLARPLAMHARDVLVNAQVFSSMEAAIAGSDLVFAASGKIPKLNWPTVTSKELSSKLIAAKPSKVAIVFGTESNGLTRVELQRCHYRLVIPGDPAYTSLNLAQAVLLVAYELFLAFGKPQQSSIDVVSGRDTGVELADMAEYAGLFSQLEQASLASGFLKAEKPRKLMARLRRLFLRARLDKTEVNILRGLLNSFMPREETVK